MQSCTAFCLTSLMVVLFAAPGFSKKRPSEYPNVIVILADDMGYDAVSAYNEKLGLKTEAIDRLAGQGIRFVDAHSTSAVCSPTRYGLLTGRYNWRSRLKRGIVGVWERPLIESSRLTLPEMFRERGFKTAMIGKWHLGWNWPDRSGKRTSKLHQIDFSKPTTGGPISHGFDYYFGDDVPNWPPYAWRENEKIIGHPNAKMKAGAMVGVSAGPAVDAWDFRAVLHEYGNRCEQYIRDRAEDRQPFFLYFPMPSPHTPIAPHKSFQGKSGISEYADFLLQTDSVIGKITKALKNNGLDDNTVVFFTCDNGTSPKAQFEKLEKSNIQLRQHWRGWKADIYEGGHRVPFIVRWPGKVKPGTVSKQVITTADIMATCASILDYPLPANSAADSVSLMPVLLGEQNEQKPLHSLVVHHSVSGKFAVRQGVWKLCFCYGSGGWSPPREPAAKAKGLPPIQLFDLKQDPKETRNVFESHPDVVKRLTAAFREIVEQGRSTPGPKQFNHGQETWWQGLPWGANQR